MVIKSCLRADLPFWVCTARAKNVFNQSSHFFTLSITNQNAQKTIENEESKAKAESQAFCCGEKQLSQKTNVQIVFRFSREIFTLYMG